MSKRSWYLLNSVISAKASGKKSGKKKRQVQGTLVLQDSLLKPFSINIISPERKLWLWCIIYNFRGNFIAEESWIKKKIIKSDIMESLIQASILE